MPRLSDSEWQVLTALWDSGGASLGEVVEAGPTEDLFARPRDKRTEDYITGRFG